MPSARESREHIVPRWYAKIVSSVVHVNSVAGHRGSYSDLFSGLLGLEASTGAIRGQKFRELIAARYVLFATLDDDYAGFALVAFLRALFGRPTSGLFLRPMQCFRRERPVIYFAKRMLFRILRRLPRAKILSIVPFDIEPRLREVCSDWIYDPQLWDHYVTGRLDTAAETPLSRKVRGKADGRPILVFLGSVRKIKGFRILSETIARTEGFHAACLVVVAGKVDEDCRADADMLVAAGAIVEDRFVTDDEIDSLYRASTHVWCCYDPSYDQASGIFGRAVQFGKVAVVRSGSILDALSRPPLSLGPVLRMTQGDSLDPGALNTAATAASGDGVDVAALAQRSLSALGASCEGSWANGR